MLTSRAGCHCTELSPSVFHNSGCSGLFAALYRFNVLSGTKPFEPVPADFQKSWRLQQLDCNMGTGLGIGQSMMVIGQVITTGCGNRLQLMVRQTAAEMIT